MTVAASLLISMLAVTPTQTVARVQAVYDAAGDLEASFTQTYYEKLRGKSRSESGHLWAKRDGRVRWDYQRPVRKYFIYDGKTAYFYEPANAQVTEFERFEHSKLSSALRFVVGQGDIAKTFEIRACESHCELATIDGKVHEAVALWPRERIPTVAHVMLIIDAKSSRVRKSILFDPLGNRTEYAFSDVAFNAKISDERFVFRPPDGIERLRARWDESGKERVEPVRE